MNLSGIRPCAGFYDYNTIKNSEVQNHPIPEEKAVKAVEALSVTDEEKQEQTDYNGPDPKRSEDLGATEFAGRYQPDVTYELKGAESDVANLDVEKAISDMKKDQVLQQYQFFVGEHLAGEELADLRANENFSL